MSTFVTTHAGNAGAHCLFVLDNMGRSDFYSAKISKQKLLQLSLVSYLQGHIFHHLT